jgi:hypothetical protein
LVGALYASLQLKHKLGYTTNIPPADKKLHSPEWETQIQMHQRPGDFMKTSKDAMVTDGLFGLQNYREMQQSSMDDLMGKAIEATRDELAFEGELKSAVEEGGR